MTWDRSRLWALTGALALASCSSDGTPKKSDSESAEEVTGTSQTSVGGSSAVGPSAASGTGGAGATAASSSNGTAGSAGTDGDEACGECVVPTTLCGPTDTGCAAELGCATCRFRSESISGEEPAIFANAASDVDLVYTTIGIERQLYYTKLGGGVPVLVDAARAPVDGLDPRVVRDASGTLHIAYRTDYDPLSQSPSEVRYARGDGVTFAIETIAETATLHDIQLGADDQLQVLLSRTGGASLATRSQAGWQEQSVNEQAGTWDAALALGGDGTPHVAISYGSQEQIWYGYLTEAGWSGEIIADTGPAGSIDIAVSTQGQVLIQYASQSSLMLVQGTSGAWTSERLPGSISAGLHALLLDQNDIPYSFANADSTSTLAALQDDGLVLKSFVGGRWAQQLLASCSTPDPRPVADFAPDGSLHVAYSCSNILYLTPVAPYPAEHFAACRRVQTRVCTEACSCSSPQCCFAENPDSLNCADAPFICENEVEADLCRRNPTLPTDFILGCEAALGNLACTPDDQGTARALFPAECYPMLFP